MGKDEIAAAERIAAQQHGALARRQAVGCDLSDKVISRLVKSERWSRPRRGVYVVRGSPATFHQRVMIAVLDECDGAAASHLAAGYLHRLITTRPARIDVTVPLGTHDGRRRRSLVHGATALGPADVRRVDGVPVTCVARTLVDLAGVTDDDQLQHALDTALNEGLIKIDVLESYIEERNLGHLRGVGKLKRFMKDRRAGAFGSGLERKFRRILRSRGIPQPERQERTGEYRIDFAYPDYGIAIEVDGDWHGTVAQLRKDDRRQNTIVLAGYAPLRFTEDRIDDEPNGVCDEVEAALRAKGWRQPKARSKRG